MFFEFLANSLFKDCHVEAYSYWVKKRVLVFEYGLNGKIKLGVEPHEQGALIDFTVGRCAFHELCTSKVDALMYYFRKDLANPSVVIIFAKKDFVSNVQSVDIEQIVEAVKGVSADLNIKFIIATHSPKEQVNNLFAGLNYPVYIGSYSDYIGRDVEEFIKE